MSRKHFRVANKIFTYLKTVDEKSLFNPLVDVTDQLTKIFDLLFEKDGVYYDNGHFKDTAASYFNLNEKMDVAFLL